MRLQYWFFVLAALSVVAVAQAPAPDSPALEAEAHRDLAKLTLEQKIALLGGTDGYFTQPMPALGLPKLKMSDASVGVRTWGPTTAYAGGVALAATWDVAFARVLGQALGRDARARGVDFLLGPGVNLARSPIAGRNFEYLSEDPYLNAALVVPFIEGVQSQGVVATVKHYALNNQEFDRQNASSDVDERTMRELYLPAFEAAVTRAHVDAVMSSYNLVNGVHSTQNRVLNLQILKDEWGFQGVLMSDWGATHDAVAAANNGLDLEMPSARYMNARNLLAAVQSGQVAEATIDDKVLRLLRLWLRYGFETARPQFDPQDATFSVPDRAVALAGALESITLLKNTGALLPLQPDRMHVVAVVGPDAWPAVTGGGGSSEATPFAAVDLVTGIGNLLGPGVSVLYARGLNDDATALCRNTRWQNGVAVQSYGSAEFTNPLGQSKQPYLADWRPAGAGGRGGPGGRGATPAPAPAPAVRYTASFQAPQAGAFVLLAGAGGQDSFHVRVDGKEVLAKERGDGQVPKTVSLTLAGGQTIQVVADYVPRAAAAFSLGIAYEPDLVSDDARTFAAKADAVVVAVGFNAALEGEGHDRTFDLPWGQDALVEAMLAANPHTIVTLTGGGGMNVSRWIDRAPAVLDDWYPGQEGGTAIAQVIFGEHNPEGRLPVSFDRVWTENPSYPWYYGTPATDGGPADRHIVYGDKLMVGYRYWTTTGKQPLFPFGFGLSYTSFTFSHLRVPADMHAGDSVPVSFDVTNTGAVAGAEVAQLYVSDPSARVDRPERELKGFAKVQLEPHASRQVTLTLDARAFSYWDENAHKWTIDPGRFVIRVGGSSVDTPLQADLVLR